MNKHTNTTFTCEACGASTTVGITCDACTADRIRKLLASRAWLAARGSASGDLPGETLADTLRRQLRGLEAVR